MRPCSSTTVTAAPTAGQARQRDLEAMLHDHQRAMQNTLQHRVRHLPSEGTREGRDEIEHAEAEIQEHLDVALIQMKRENLQRVQEALARCDAGDYGICVECEGEIAESRLRALPFAVRCTACEESREQLATREQRVGLMRGFPFIFAG